MSEIKETSQVMSPTLSGHGNSESSIVSSVPKLNSGNYMDWSWAIMVALSDDSIGIWEYITDKVSDEDYYTLTQDSVMFNRRNMKAIRLLMATVTPTDYTALKCGNARQAWLALKEKYLRDNAGNRATLLTQLCQLTMKEPTIDAFHEYYNSVLTIVERLTNLETKVMDIFAVLMLRGIHDKLHNVVSLIAQSEQDLSLTIIAKRVETELEMTSQSPNGTETGNALQVRQSSFKPTYRSDQCRFCRQTGHWAKDCPTLNKNRKSSNFPRARGSSGDSGSANVVTGPLTDDTPVSLGNLWLCGNDSTSDDWFFDGGASKHMCKDSATMYGYSPVSNSFVTVANGQRLSVVGKGDILVRLLLPNGQPVQRTLRNVLHVPGIVKNLISNHELASVNGVKVIEGSLNLELRLSDGTEILAGAWDTDQDAYRLVGQVIYGPKSNGHALSAESSDVLHRRFSHIGKSQIAEYVKQGLIDPPIVDHVCPSCAEGKSHRLPYERSSTKPLHPIEELHSDVLGPFDVVSAGGAKYVCSLIDGFSGYLFVSFLKEKRHVSEFIQKHIRMLNNLFLTQGLSVKYLRSDNGGEYVNRELNQFLSDSGIQHRLTAPYTPQQNGVAERYNRTMVEDALTLLKDSGLPKKFWPEAIGFSVHVRNRLPSSRSGKTQSPYAMLFGRQPELNHIRTFGCTAWINVTKDQRIGKLTPKGRRGVMLGFGEYAKAYRIYCPSTGRVHLGRDVVFDELLMASSCFEKENIEVPSRNDSIVRLELSTAPKATDISNSDTEMESLPDTDVSSRMSITQDELESPPQRTCTGSEAEFGLCTHRRPVLLEDLDQADDDGFQLTTQTQDIVMQDISEEQVHNDDSESGYTDELVLARGPQYMALPSSDEEEQLEGGEIIVEEVESSRSSSPDVLQITQGNETENASSRSSSPDILAISRIQNKPDDQNNQQVVKQPQYELRKRQMSSSPSVGSESEDQMACERETQLVLHSSIQRNRPPKKIGRANATSFETLPSEPTTLRQAQANGEWQHWKQACQDELDSLTENNVWELTDLPPGRAAISSKWIFKRKFNADGEISRYKARLVARGFTQERGVDFWETFAPTVRIETIRALLAWACHKDYEIHQLDVKTAFLYGNLDEEIYLEQLPGYTIEGGKVWKLKKSLYGLKQAPRCWNSVLHEFLVNNGFIQSLCDPCLYRKEGPTDHLYLAVYVDDIIIIGNTSSGVEEFKRTMASKFKMSDIGELGLFLGIRVQRDRKAGTLFLSQSKYVKDLLEKHGMEDCNAVRTPLESDWQNDLATVDERRQPDSRFPYQSVIGSLNYLVSCTRPDLAYCTGALARFNNCYDISHWNHAKRVLRYLKGTSDYGLLFKKDKKFGLYAYSDADWAGDKQFRRSTSGRIVFLNETPIMWKSKLQGSVADSSTAAEYMALTPTVKDIIWMRRLLKFIGVATTDATTIFEDNMGAIKLAKNPMFHDRSKHIEVRFHYVREQLEAGTITLKHVATENMLADIMTKALGGTKFNLAIPYLLSDYSKTSDQEGL